MTSKKDQRDSNTIRLELIELLTSFEQVLLTGDLRRKVIHLVPSAYKLRELGSSLMPNEDEFAARDRILSYFRQYPRTVIAGDELMIVAGIGEWARRLRELRVEFGWPIINGITAKQAAAADDFSLDSIDIGAIGPDEYILLEDAQDLTAATRWNLANDIKKKKGGVKSKILQFFQMNVGQVVTNEELRYVAGKKTEWARRVRELRTEEGWPILTRYTGRPDLQVGAYVLEENRQSPPHDRKIPDDVRGSVLRRDDYKCTKCGWNQELWNRSDPRHLELHHVEHHAKGGENTEENLITLCTICHDKLHSNP